MADYSISCPFCGQAFTLQQDQLAAYMGQRVPCSNCHKQFTVTDVGGVRAVPPVSDNSQPPELRPPSRTNGLAIAGLVCGILGFFTAGLAGIPGLICSILGLRKAKREHLPAGLALAGVIVSSLSLLILLLLVLALPPALMRARQSALQVACMSNLRMVGMGVMMYANDNRGGLPASPTQLGPYLGTPSGKGSPVFICPARAPEIRTVDGMPCSYYFVPWAGRMTDVRAASQEVLAYEPFGQHRDKTNVLYLDGHVEGVAASDPTGVMVKTLLAGDPDEIARVAGSAQEALWFRVAAIGQLTDRAILQKLADTPDRNIAAAAKARLLSLEKSSAAIEQ